MVIHKRGRGKPDLVGSAFVQRNIYCNELHHLQHQLAKMRHLLLQAGNVARDLGNDLQTHDSRETANAVVSSYAVKVRDLTINRFDQWLHVYSLSRRTLFVVCTECERIDRKSTRLNSSHVAISYAVFC